MSDSRRAKEIIDNVNALSPMYLGAQYARMILEREIALALTEVREEGRLMQ